MMASYLTGQPAEAELTLAAVMGSFDPYDRDRYRVEAETPLGTPAESTSQKRDRAAAEAALKAAQSVARNPRQEASARRREARGLRI